MNLGYKQTFLILSSPSNHIHNLSTPSIPCPVFKKDKEKLWLQYQKEITQIRQDKYEKQLLKTFDFVAWIESNLTNSSYQEILLRIQKEKK